MAKGRRSKMGTRKRVRADWCYRPSLTDADNSYLSTGGWISAAETWDITNNVDNARTLVLYDSHDFMAALTNLTLLDGYAPPVAAIDSSLPAVSRVESKRSTTVHAVQGEVYLRPTSWTLGERLLLKARLGWLEQDPYTGQVLIDPLWSIWDPAGANPAIQANPVTSHIHDFVIASAARENSSTPTLVWRMLWKGKRRAPDSHHALVLWLEAPINTLFSNVTMRCSNQVRALMSGN